MINAIQLLLFSQQIILIKSILIQKLDRNFGRITYVVYKLDVLQVLVNRFSTRLGSKTTVRTYLHIINQEASEEIAGVRH